MDPTNSQAIYNLGITYNIKGNSKKAAEYMEQAIELEPENWEWRNFISKIYFNIRELENARVHLVESLRLNNQEFDTRL